MCVRCTASPCLSSLDVLWSKHSFQILILKLPYKERKGEEKNGPRVFEERHIRFKRKTKNRKKLATNNGAILGYVLKSFGRRTVIATTN